MNRRVHIVLGVALAGVLVVAAALSVSPAGNVDSPPNQVTQVVYRFDDHRYLELVGKHCEGAIDYIDTERGIKTRVIQQFARVFLPDIIHADKDGDYLFIPYDDISAFRVSKDHGETFQTARWVGSRTFGVEGVKRVTVVNQQAYVQLRDGRLFMTSKPFGEYWGLEVIDPVNVLPNKVHRDYPEFQGLPTEVPEVKDYKGWTQMRCDPDLGADSNVSRGSQ